MGWPPNREILSSTIANVLRPGHFFVAREVRLSLDHVEREEVFWELYRGKLMGAGQTREMRVFECWNINLRGPGPVSPEPVISVKLDWQELHLHVTRSLRSYAWEAYATEGNVVLSRETEKWVSELVGTIYLDEPRTMPEFSRELAGLIYQAVVGTSRLPLTSLEAPLPGFSLGRFGYIPGLADSSESSSEVDRHRLLSLLAAGCGERPGASEQAKMLELLIRSCDAKELGELAHELAGAWQGHFRSAGEFIFLCRTLINETALSPYTDFVDKLVAFLDSLHEIQFLSVAQRVDLISYVLRHLVRHLTAYDLVTYHHRGANYPDALVLDRVLRSYLEAMRAWPDHFLARAGDSDKAVAAKQRRRRALRQAWLMRNRCVGLPVPDMPTSPGESRRWLPPPFLRVPEEQITNPETRTKQLFVDQPLLDLGPEGRQIFQQSIADLDSPLELRELGTALFLDRPLGVFKESGERDQTPLLSYECFSPNIALDRLRQLGRDSQLAPLTCLPKWEARVRGELSGAGLLLRLTNQKQRPGTVSLDDAVRVSGDFRVLRSTRGPLDAFLQAFDFSPVLGWISFDLWAPGNTHLLLQAASIGPADLGDLLLFDEQLRPRIQVKVDASRGYAIRTGQEFPAAGLLVERIWTPGMSRDDLNECDLKDEVIRLLPRYT